jgi:hypothetical protein
MFNVPDLLEQITFAINKGGPTAVGGGGPIEAFALVSNIGKNIGATPFSSTAPTNPQGPYSPDLLPLMEQMAWAINNASTDQNVYTFIKTIAYYLQCTVTLQQGEFKQRNTPPLPAALHYMPTEDLSLVYQVTYWLINEGKTFNPKAWGFLKALSYYLFKPIGPEGTGQFRYPN